MSFVEEKQRGLTLGPPELVIELIEHLTTISVAPPPAGTAVCRPLYLLHMLNLSFTIWAPNRSQCYILQFRLYQRFACNLLSTPRCESQVPAKET